MRIGTANDWTEVKPGTFSTLGLRNGTLWSWGDGGFGLLGTGSTAQVTVPTRVGTGTGWRRLMVASNNAVATDSAEQVYRWGYNLYGQIGNGLTTRQTTPLLLSPDFGWSHAAIGRNYTLFLRNDGSLWASGNPMSSAISPAGRNYKGPVALLPSLAIQTLAVTPSAVNSYRMTSSSGLPVSIKILAGDASVSGNEITLTNPASLRAVVMAWQAGDESAWNAAAPQSFTIGTGSLIPPGVSSPSHSELTATSARVSATFTSPYSLSSGWFEYTTAPGSIEPTPTRTQPLGATTGGVTASQVLTGLKPGTTYHYRPLIHDSAAISTTGFETFTTLSAEVLVTDQSIAKGNGGTYDLGDVPMGTSVTRAYIVTNALSSSSLTLTSLELSGADEARFQINSASAITTLAPGHSTSFTVTFTPTVAGTKSASLAIHSDAPSAIPFILNLMATGLAQPGPAQSIVGPSVIPSRAASDGAFELPLVSTAGLPLTYEVINGAGGTVTGNVFSPSLNGGVVTLRITQAGGGGYDAAPTVYRSFVVGTGRYVKLGIGPMATHGAGIRDDGSLWTWGMNSAGQVGNDTLVDVAQPINVRLGWQWHSVALGSGFTAAIRSNGTLWTWGASASGQLGHGDLTIRRTPKQVGTDANWAQVAAGESFVIAVRSDGTLWSWGSNSQGELGLGDSVSRSTPTQVGIATDWSRDDFAIGAGNLHAMARKADGTLWTWGLNSSGQLGQGNTTNLNSPVQVGSLTTWSKVACGGSHSIAIQSDGSLWAWGLNSSSQLGNGGLTNATLPTKIGSALTWRSIAAGETHSVATQTDLSLWTFGLTTYGRLGRPSTPSAPAPVDLAGDCVAASAGRFGSLAIKSNGTLQAAGSANGLYQGRSAPEFVRVASPGIEVCVSDSISTHFIKSDGTLWAVGSGSTMGDDNLLLRAKPVQIGTDSDWMALTRGGSFLLALKTNGSLWGVGSNISGQLGDGSTTSRTRLTQIPGATWKSIAAGLFQGVGVKADGTLWTWGFNVFGLQVGGVNINSIVYPIQLGTDSDWKFVTSSGNGLLAIKTDGSLWAMGSNSSGQLGLGHNTSSMTLTRVGTDNDWRTVSSNSHTVATKTDGSLWVWGNNGGGRLGIGSTVSNNAPVRVGARTDWVDAKVGGEHSVALTADGTLWGCGGNTQGQLATQDTRQRTTWMPIGQTKAWKKLGSSSGLATLAITGDGSLWAVGDNAGSSLSDSARVNSQFGSVHPGPVMQSISFPNPGFVDYHLPIPLAASSSSGLPIEYVVSGPALLSGSELTVTGPGEVKLLAYQGGDGGAWLTAPLVQAVWDFGIADLTSLGLSTGSLTAPMTHEQTSYQAAVLAGTTTLTLTPQLKFAGATITVNGQSVADGASSQPIPINSGPVTIQVIPADRPVGRTYTLTVAFINNFTEWAQLNELPLNPSLDADGDQIVNLLEFAFGTDVRTPGTDFLGITDNVLTQRGKPTVIPNPSGPGLAALFPRLTQHAAVGLVYTVHFSHDLASWEPSSIPPTIQADDGAVQACTIPFPALLANNQPPRFFKVQVTSP